MMWQGRGAVCWMGLAMALAMLVSDPLSAAKPNIVLILCDDLGYGDVKALNPQGKIKTPNMDRLAKEGVTFTDAHSSSAVCTPTRYALLTGRYNWRSRLQNGVLGGMSPRLIEPDRMTIAQMLRDQGYATACVGKWHLGLDWLVKDAKPGFGDSIEEGKAGWQVDFTKPFANGPITLGFDYYFGISASLDMVPYTFLENDRVTVLPEMDNAFPMMLGRNPDKTTRRGPAAKDFDANQVLPRLAEKSIELIRGWSEDAKAGKPFFLYLPLASPHTPIVPTQAWQGASGLNPYADFVMQTDDAIGQILTTLDQQGLAGDTLVILTSDNGCSPQADFPELEGKGHDPSYVFRGHKADIFEGGHRVPYIARWPRGLPAGAQCEAIVGLQDTFATCAHIVSAKVADGVAEDSFSWLPRVTKGSADGPPSRESLVHHSINGSFALRRGKWKLCFCPDSGGWSEPRPNAKSVKDLPALQLFDLEADIAEQVNVADRNPDVVQSLTDEMEALIGRGRSTPGGPQQNTVPVKWKRPQLPAKS